MSETSAFCLFCEDVRQEAGGHSTFIGVVGGTLYFDPQNEIVDRLKAVCIARVPSEDIRTIEVKISANVILKGKRAQAPDYTATFSRHDDDNAPEWELQLVLNLKGMPVEEGAVAEVCFSANGAKSIAHLMFTCDKDLHDTLIDLEPGVTSSSGLPPAKRKARKKIAR